MVAPVHPGLIIGPSDRWIPDLAGFVFFNLFGLAIEKRREEKEKKNQFTPAVLSLDHLFLVDTGQETWHLTRVSGDETRAGWTSSLFAATHTASDPVQLTAREGREEIRFDY